MKKYEVTIYGRTNTILTGIRSKKLYSEIIISDNKNNAKKEALNNFYMFINDLWKGVLNRFDIKKHVYNLYVFNHFIPPMLYNLNLTICYHILFLLSTIILTFH